MIRCSSRLRLLLLSDVKFWKRFGFLFTAIWWKSMRKIQVVFSSWRFQPLQISKKNLMKLDHHFSKNIPGGVENQRNLWGFHYQLSSSRDFRKNSLWPFAPRKKELETRYLDLLEKVLTKMAKIYRLYQYGGENSDFHPMWSNPKKHHLT